MSAPVFPSSSGLESLRRCPFCGLNGYSLAVIHGFGHVSGEKFPVARVECVCGTHGPTMKREKATAADAMAAWNNRTGDLAQAPVKSVDEIAAEITEEIRCEERARERVAKADEISGDIYLLKVLLSVISGQNAALREYEAAASSLSSTSRAPGPLVPWELKCQREVCAAPECECPAMTTTEGK